MLQRNVLGQLTSSSACSRKTVSCGQNRSRSSARPSRWIGTRIHQRILQPVDGKTIAAEAITLVPSRPILELTLAGFFELRRRCIQRHFAS